MKKVRGRLTSTNTSSGLFLYLPTRIIQDSAFPFPDARDVVIEISGRRLIVREPEEDEKEEEE